MNPALTDVWLNTRNLAVGALAHANRHAAYAAIENPRWPDLAVLQAAHAAELFIKARIAQEHPLLIFEQLPRSAQSTGSQLDLEDLFRRGRTLQWPDLPERLWATTGLSVPSRQCYDDFGLLRNGIQHFGPPTGVNAGAEALRFVFEVIDPFINDCWGLFAVDCDEDPDPFIYFVGAPVRLEIPFLVSPDAAARFEEWDVDWSEVSPTYAAEMKSRVENVLHAHGGPL